MRYTKLKRVLHKFMYHDYATVYRQQSALDEQGADDYTIELIYKNIPCKLSQYGKEITGLVTDRQVEQSIDLRITCEPNYDIKANDIVKVLHLGQEFTLNSVKAFKYPTHQEISLRRKEDV